MQQHRDEEALDVVGIDVRTPIEQRPSTHGPVEGKRTADRAAGRDGVDGARRADEPDGPGPDQRVDIDLLHGPLHGRYVVERHHRPQFAKRVAADLLLDDPELLRLGGIAERRAEEEAVELSLRKQERALLFDRVLGRHQQERPRQRPGNPVRADLALVDEQHVREHRPRPELEVTLLRVEDGQPGDVRRLEVRRALDARGRCTVDRLSDRPCQNRLRGPRHVLEQDVPAAHQCREHELDLVRLAVDDELDVVEQPRCRDRGAVHVRTVLTSSPAD